ncbi:MAG: hypothetical protein HC806_08275 [Anaerolineae bacterium]|nr:hypothetical protein [Anaerolineae bacterium]
MLKPRGEIHVLDSPLYLQKELPEAQNRTQKYYASLGFPEMAAHYHHHTVSDLQPFSPIWLYNPNHWVNRVKQRLGLVVSPFPWVVIRLGS